MKALKFNLTKTLIAISVLLAVVSAITIFSLFQNPHSSILSYLFWGSTSAILILCLIIACRLIKENSNIALERKKIEQDSVEIVRQLLKDQFMDNLRYQIATNSYVRDSLAIKKDKGKHTRDIELKIIDGKTRLSYKNKKQ